MDYSVLRKFKYFEHKDLEHSFDPLTGVLARDVMEDYINDLIKRNVPFSFCLIDVDNFKTVNDSFGHQVGDKVLTCTARYLVAQAGDAGVVARYGGDEFMMVFENVVEYKDIWSFGHKTNMHIAEIDFGGIQGVSITISMGISRCPLDANTYEGILQLADKALYRGKTKGRNCFIIYLKEKHANIDINKEREKSFTSMHLNAMVFHYLTETDKIENNIQSLFKYFVSYFMLDHICIESDAGMNLQAMHALSKNRSFRHMKLSDINKLVNNTGLVYINKIENRNDIANEEIFNEFCQQKIKSTFYCRVAAFGSVYGFIRVDMSDTVRIWQRDEMDLLVVAAHTIGLLLHYSGKTLDELERVKPVMVGEV